MFKVNPNSPIYEFYYSEIKKLEGKIKDNKELDNIINTEKNLKEDIVINKLSKHQAKNKLSLTIRRINQLIQIFNREGKVGFIHKSHNKISNKTTKIEIKNKIINLYKQNIIILIFNIFMKN